jgi:Leucine-rich repeat (LRR) protein
MNRIFSWQRLTLTTLLALAISVAAGCKQNTKVGGDKEAKPEEPIGSTPANEDPVLVEHAKKNNWWLLRDMRVSDGRPVVVLAVKNTDKNFDDIEITLDDYKIIAKTKTVQVIDLTKVKNPSEEGLKLIAGIPTLDTLSLSGEGVADGCLKTIAQCKTLEIVSVAGAKKATAAGIKELATLPKLKEVHLSFMEIDGAALAAFGDVKTLQVVKLQYADGLTDDGVKQLARLPNLNELRIGKGFGTSTLTSAGIKAIVDARLPAKFEFDKKLLDDDLFTALVAKGWLYGPTPAGDKEKRPATAAEVREINLEASKVTDKGFQAVLDCTNVKFLFLGNTSIGDGTFKKLAGFQKLEYLSLEKTKVTAAGIEAIAALPIRHVALEWHDLTEDHFKAFAKMTALEDLWLANAKMNPDWLKHIIKLPNLKDLSLRDAALDDANAKQLAGMTSLTSITANSTKLGNEGFLALLKLPNLKSLNVDCTQVTKEVYQNAKKDYSKVSLYYYAFDR